MTRNEWHYQGFTIKAFRDGCVSMPCVHFSRDNPLSMSIKKTEELKKRLDKAIKYCKGRKRKYKDDLHNWHPEKW